MKKLICLIAVVLCGTAIFAQRGGERREEAPRRTETLLTIDATNITSDENYSVVTNEYSYACSPGVVKEITMYDLTVEDDITITIPAHPDLRSSQPIDIIFNISEGEIINLHGEIEYEGERTTYNFDDEEFIQTEGTTITFFSEDQSDVLSSDLYLTLEKGLVFSPDGDGSYDELSLVMEGDYDFVSFQVSKIDGTVMYETTRSNFSWDGTVDRVLVNEGTYNYTIQIGEELIQGQFLIEY